MKVVVTRRARSELRDIGRYVAGDDPAAAERLVADLYARLAALADVAERGMVVGISRTRPIRRLVHGAYLIIYTVDVDAVRVLRVVHGARSPKLLLRDIDPQA
ncbi:type II toxin-antitoxin system RelE/ParE family toxin [Methylopila turkensis]|uniref:Plasmid stabilization protein n=1 Tax=Methylopila turkensis TaxID=1437816 RepID=A0A9W6JP96_9HYPH|nr:type II toxin-antitoxin system RelE/ParE family toxin [Methylopila turkensis]GLK80016.1 plasmid stabilization protein [Methylopila turkensis]